METFFKPRNISLLIIASGLLTLVGVALGAFNELTPSESIWPHLIGFSIIGIIFIICALPNTFRPIFYHGLLFLGSATITMLFLYNPSVHDNVITLFFVFSGIATLVLNTRPAFLWVVSFYLISLASVWFYYGLSGTLGLVSAGGGFLFFALFGLILKQTNLALQKNQQLAEELTVTNQQLRLSQQQAQQVAVVEERNRLAREMHDSLGHRLTVAVVQLEGASRLIPKNPERASKMVDDMRGQLKDGLKELRQTLSALRTDPDQTTGVNDLPLANAIETLAGTFSEATSLPIHLEIDQGKHLLTNEQHNTLYRAAQEGLTNIQRHANATEAWVTLSAENNHLSLTVADNGSGLPADLPEGRFGLLGLQERAKQIGGRFEITQRQPSGTILEFTIPLKLA